MAHASLYLNNMMERRFLSDWRCSMLVVLDGPCSGTDELRDLAAYLSDVRLHGFEVVVIDTSPADGQEQNRRVLRWVSRYVAARPQHYAATGNIDPVRAATELAACDKVIVADARTRYDREALDAVCTLLELHEVVEPEHYYHPLPWWGGIDAARALVRRGIGPLPEHASTFAFRKSAIRALSRIDPFTGQDCLCRLASRGAEVFAAPGVFVRRLPPMLHEWFRDSPLRAGSELSAPLRAAFFSSIIPLAWLLAMIGGAKFVLMYATAIGAGALAMALRGRIGAARYFPMRACLFAPLSVLERSIGVYWALLWKVSGGRDTRRIPMPVRSGDERAASSITGRR